MTKTLNTPKIRELLENRRAELNDSLHKLYLEHGINPYEARDRDDESVDDMQKHVASEGITRETNELKRIDLALTKLDSGIYGLCSDCGEEIDLVRLEVNPTALRCVRCQTLYEEKHGISQAD